MATPRDQPDRGPTAWREALALLAGAGVAAAGALLLGEYAFTGWPIFAGCALLGLFVAEAVISVARRRGVRVGAASALLAAAGLTWAAWISTGHVLDSLPTEGWLAVAAGALVAAVTAGWPARAAGTRPAPSGTD